MSEEASARVWVAKKTASGQASLLYLPIPTGSPAGTGFRQLADYDGRTVFEGPVAGAPGLVQEFLSHGYEAAIATELDTIRYHGHNIDGATGAIDPAIPSAGPPTGTAGLYILTLKAFPIADWLADLRARRIRVLEALPHGAYIVRGPRDALTGLLEQTEYARGVFLLPPALKKVLFTIPSRSLWRVAISAVEEDPEDSIRNYLDSVSQEPVSVSGSDGLLTYTAAITDLDIDVLTTFETVYSISPRLEAAPSSERQAVLTLQPTVGGTGQLTLPDVCPNYGALLAAKCYNGLCIVNFANTKVGILDTGFDDGTTGHPDLQFGGAPTILRLLPNPAFGSNVSDKYTHGTLVTSVISGWVPFATRAQETPTNHYRYSHGLAPTVATVMYKFIECSGYGNTLGDGLSSLEAFQVSEQVNLNVVNASINDPGAAGCVYNDKSRLMDSKTRANKWLLTVSAGNTPDGGDCVNVRAPGTAKNVLTMGASDSFTLAWRNDADANRAAICDWDWTPPEADARNIPSFSARARTNAQGAFDSVIKPDLVAPGLRVTGPVSRPPTGLCFQFGVFCNDEDLAVDSGITYGASAGTSFAAPAAAGAAAVVRRWYRNLNGDDPSPAMTKAMLINGARDLGPAAGVTAAHVLNVDTSTTPHRLILGDPIGNIPNKFQGWGMLNLARLLGPPTQYYFFDQGVRLAGGGDGWGKVLYVADGTKTVRITAVWTDPEAAVGAQGDPYPVTNDLNLLGAGGSPAVTWQGNLLSGGASLQRPPAPIVRDAINNVEQLIIPPGKLATGDPLVVSLTPWNIVVGTQDFALFVDNAAEPASGLYTVAPCRVLDTRNPAGPYGGPPLGAGADRTVAIAGQCGVPTTAKSLAVNVTVTGGTAAGDLRLFPGGLSAPTASMINYTAGQTVANNGTYGLGPAGITLHSDQASGSVDVILDIVGYFQ